MRLEGLTDRQMMIADTLWSLHSSADCKAWLDTLSRPLRDEALVVMELMLIASVDDVVDDMDFYPDAEDIINSIIKK